MEPGGRATDLRGGQSPPGTSHPSTHRMALFEEGWMQPRRGPIGKAGRRRRPRPARGTHPAFAETGRGRHSRHGLPHTRPSCRPAAAAWPWHPPPRGTDPSLAGVPPLPCIERPSSAAGHLGGLWDAWRKDMPGLGEGHISPFGPPTRPLRVPPGISAALSTRRNPFLPAGEGARRLLSKGKVAADLGRTALKLDRAPSLSSLCWSRE